MPAQKKFQSWQGRDWYPALPLSNAQRVERGAIRPRLIPSTGEGPLGRARPSSRTQAESFLTRDSTHDRLLTRRLTEEILVIFCRRIVLGCTIY